MPDGKGLVLTKPDEAGKWRMRAFAFVPSQIVVKAGDTVRLHFR
jgi:plastocyanin